MASPLRPAKLYLLAYNSLQWLGWTLSLSRILREAALTNSTNGAYSSSGDIICLTQTLSFLEVIHSAAGLVPSGALTSLMQWGGRTHFLLAVVRGLPEVQELPSVFITFVAWSVSDMIRYIHYVLSGTGICPSWLTYLRYTAFIVMYPIGVGPGEMWLMYKALPFIKEKNLYSAFFDKFSITYYSFVKVLLAFYPFLWLKLYLHLFKQRQRKMRKPQEKKDA